MHPLEKMIKEGEHTRQDFKFFLNDARKIARSLAAFANTEGGRLLVGVKDNGRIAGLKHEEEEVYVVEAAAHVFCKPVVKYTTRFWEYGGKTVLEVQVPKSNRAPHTAPDETGKHTCYVRKADENKMASELEIAVMKITHSAKPFTFTINSQHERLLEVLRRWEQTGDYDLKELSRQSLMTRKECITALAGLIASGTIQTPR
ncbi:MAG TPA: ATP-binding protein [Bacteroidales bacterium]|nr:MAG: Divergent AAA domain protein [Bacteroidetes bacterium ADurb.Bin037]HPV88318.1 ATP-binding protein [Bacteroidales bacterium]HPW78962.1 ATP-binding protein [Bacteroidales bacterium]HQB56493.1 ATP-binding protein [Bacteroidales bacterium]